MTAPFRDLPPSVYQRLDRLARRAAPEEAVVLLQRAFTGRRYWQLRCLPNLSATPRADFATPADLLDDARLTADIILFHSHPTGPAWPSYADMAGQIDTAIPWLIADLSGRRTDFFWLGGPRPPLDGRGFRHGVTDCYALIRDLYHERLGLVLPDWPRNWLWWQQGEAYYETLFTRTGFVALGPDQIPQPFDICLMRIRSDTANHAAVLLDDGRLYHHLAGRHGYDPARLPRRDPAMRWTPYIQTWLRHASRLQEPR